MAVPKHIRVRFSFLSDQIRRGIPLDQQQSEIIARALKDISDGDDPMVVFGGQRKKGIRKTDEDTKEKIRDVLSRVTCDLVCAKKEGVKLTIASAIRNNVTFANEIFGCKNKKFPTITEEKIRRWWDTKKYLHFRTPVIDPFAVL